MPRTAIATLAAPSANFPGVLSEFFCGFSADSPAQVRTYLYEMADLVQEGGEWTDATRLESDCSTRFLLSFAVCYPAEIPSVMRAVADAIGEGNMWSSVRNADDMEIGYHQVIT